MEPHQHRVHIERGELNERLSRLTSFFKTDTYDALPKDEKERLLRQHGLMVQYLQVLDERIAHFGRS